MNRIAQFMTVSRSRFEQDWCFDSPCPYDELVLPRRATAGSAGYDFFAPMDFEIAAGASIKIPTGIRAKIEEGWVLVILPRSGQGFKYRIQLYNTAGVIDSDYRGEICAVFLGTCADLQYKVGDRIAQMIILPIPAVEYQFAEELSTTERGTGGYGSTGK